MCAWPNNELVAFEPIFLADKGLGPPRLQTKWTGARVKNAVRPEAHFGVRR